MRPVPARPPESAERLWRLTIAPAIWAVHFMLCYGTAAIWCAKFAGPAGSLAGSRLAIAAYTVVALVGIAIAGAVGWQRHSLDGVTLPHDFDSPGDRHRFLGFAMLLLAGLSAVATVYTALAAVFIDTCA